MASPRDLTYPGSLMWIPATSHDSVAEGVVETGILAEWRITMRTVRLWPVMLASLLASCSSATSLTLENPQPGSQDSGSQMAETVVGGPVTDALAASSVTDMSNRCSGVTTNDAGPIDKCPCVDAVGDPSGTSCENLGQQCDYQPHRCWIVNCRCVLTNGGIRWVCLQLLC